MKTTMIILCSALTLVSTTVSLAGGHEDSGPFSREIAARRAPMTVMAFNLGILGGMAKGQVEYNVESASVAADNILAAASINQANAWPEDSDSEFAEGTKALPAIWENPDGFADKQDALIKAAMALEASAGTDLDSLRAALGGVGKACGDCHETFRAEN